MEKVFAKTLLKSSGLLGSQFRNRGTCNKLY